MPYCDKNQFPDGPDDFESAGMKLVPEDQTYKMNTQPQRKSICAFMNIGKHWKVSLSSRSSWKMETVPSVTNTTYAEATKTGVFWDVEECPIPEDLDPESVYQSIRSALANKGYHGEVKIMAFGDRNQIPGYYQSAGIEIYPLGDKYLRIRGMLPHFLVWVLENSHESSNMMIISRNGMELASAFELCKKEGHNIFFANPLNGPRICECKYEDLTTEMWVWETLAAGGDPIVKTKRGAEMSNKEEEEEVDKDSRICSICQNPLRIFSKRVIL
uniref:NYN domain-containing protein n=2 Tax=Brassica campestris TaxID=3711 RepID=M4CTI3_BRACM